MNGTLEGMAAGGARDPHPLGAGKLELLLADFGRVLGCESALLCELGADGQPRVVCSWGVDRAAAITIPRRGRRRRGGRQQRGGCFMGRALAHGRPAFETLDPDCDAPLINAAAAALTHAAAAPVRVLGTGVHGALIAGFSTPPDDLDQMFWLADSYARLIGVLVHHEDALDGLLERARRDVLTGCLNFEGVLRELEREINRGTRAHLDLSCCFIDLDGFKRVNDRYGHLRGNEALAHVAQILRDGVRSCDTVGRYGGDEFIAILPETTEPDARRLAERLPALIASANNPKLLDAPLTASVGVAQWTPGTTAEQLLAHADAALLAAKAQGGGVIATNGTRLTTA